MVEYENKSYGQERLCDSSPNIECRLCLEQLDNLDLFYAHVRIHSGAHPVECRFCFAGFADLVAMTAHVEAEHEPPNGSMVDSSVSSAGG